MLSLVFIGVGILLFIATVKFKKQIDNYYDNVKGLSARQANYYKNVVVRLVPAIFVLAGIFQFIYQGLDSEVRDNFISNMQSGNVRVIVGVLAIIAGFVTFFMRLSDNRDKYFSKLSAMEAKYGKKLGYFIHFMAYSVAPIIFGITLLLK